MVTRAAVRILAVTVLTLRPGRADPAGHDKTSHKRARFRAPRPGRVRGLPDGARTPRSGRPGELARPADHEAGGHHDLTGRAGVAVEVREEALRRQAADPVGVLRDRRDRGLHEVAGLDVVEPDQGDGVLHAELLQRLQVTLVGDPNQVEWATSPWMRFPARLPVTFPPPSEQPPHGTWPPGTTADLL